jgi:hypothetical protein
MRRSLLTALAAALLVLPVAADAHSGLRLRGTVTAKQAADGLITVSSSRLVHVLRVPGSLDRIRVGQRVELRGTVLRARGNGSRVLARGVTIARSEIRAPARDRDEDEPDDDEREVRGPISSLTPLTVAGLTCAVPARISIAGFRVGDRVEMTCDLVRGVWTLRKLQSEDARDHEDEDEDRDDDDDDHSGPGGGSGGGGRGHG